MNYIDAKKKEFQIYQNELLNHCCNAIVTIKHFKIFRKVQKGIRFLIKLSIKTRCNLDKNRHK